MRAMMHSGKSGKSGVYSPKHNDRSYKGYDAGEKDREPPIVWSWDGVGMEAEDSERFFYYEHFREGLEARNKRYHEHGHDDRIKGMDDYRRSRQSAPEENLLGLGKLGDSIPLPDLYELLMKQKQWTEATFPQIKYISVSAHREKVKGHEEAKDEASHAHERYVFIAKDKYGYDVVNMEQALKDMGIEPEGMDGRGDRYKNRKIAFTRIRREHWEGLCKEYCKEHGLTFDEERLPKSETGKSQLAYICDELKKEIKKLDEELKLKGDIKEAKAHVVEVAKKLTEELTAVEKERADLENISRLAQQIVDNGYIKDLRELGLKAVQHPKKAQEKQQKASKEKYQGR